MTLSLGSLCRGQVRVVSWGLFLFAWTFAVHWNSAAGQQPAASTGQPRASLEARDRPPAPLVLAQQPDALPRPPAVVPPVVAPEESGVGLDAASNIGQGDAEVLMRGPLHEAFDQQLLLNPEPSEVTTRKPPEPIQEVPPEVQPDEDAEWVPGYWALDDDLEDFIWVSGLWRVMPPDRRWVPGYWAESNGQYQWVSGFWQPIQQDQVDYLPLPPESLENGPTSIPPNDQAYWVQGSWLFQNNNYAWRPGHWADHREGWVWMPSHYAWTPYGAVFVPGFWDVSPIRRGFLFAPIFFRSQIYLRPGFFYRPWVACNTSRLMLHLFAHPRRSHYFWGDYYGPRYAGFGFTPWFFNSPRFCARPSFGYYQRHFGLQGINYSQRLGGWHHHFNRNPNLRPPRTFAGVASIGASAASQQSILAASTRNLRDVNRMRAESRLSPIRQVSAAQQEAVQQSTRQFRNIERQRSALESQLASTRQGNLDGAARAGGLPSRVDAPGLAGQRGGQRGGQSPAAAARRQADAAVTAGRAAAERAQTSRQALRLPAAASANPSATPQTSRGGGGLNDRRQPNSATSAANNAVNAARSRVAPPPPTVATDRSGRSSAVDAARGQLRSIENQQRTRQGSLTDALGGANARSPANSARRTNPASPLQGNARTRAAGGGDAGSAAGSSSGGLSPRQLPSGAPSINRQGRSPAAGSGADTGAALRQNPPSTRGSLPSTGAATRQSPPNIRNFTSPDPGARSTAPSLNAPTRVAQPSNRSPNPQGGSSRSFSTPRAQQPSTPSFRTPSATGGGSSSFRAPNVGGSGSSSFRTPSAIGGGSSSFRAPNVGGSGSSSFRTPSAIGGGSSSFRAPNVGRSGSPSFRAPSGGSGSSSFRSPSMGGSSRSSFGGGSSSIGRPSSPGGSGGSRGKR